MQSCIRCGNDAINGTKLCVSHGGLDKPEEVGPIHRHVSEKTRLKHEAKRLRKEIAQRQALLNQRAKVAKLREDLYEIHHRVTQR